MVKTGVCGTWINKVGEASLRDPSQALKVRMFNNVVKNLVRKGDQAINRVIKNLNFIHFSVLELD